VLARSITTFIDIFFTVGALIAIETGTSVLREWYVMVTRDITTAGNVVVTDTTILTRI
jgi:hypothetical protein